MGLLSEGNPLSWEETRDLAEHVRQHGINQFIHQYHTLKEREGDGLKWGDEVEYMIIHFDDENKRATLSLKAQEALQILNESESKDPDNVKSLWRPEYGAYMIEGTPGKPYGCLLAHFNTIEASMRFRRLEAQEVLPEGHRLLTLTSYPRLGNGMFTTPPSYPTPINGASRSLFVPDECIFPGHPRFKTLTRNIRMRRGEKVAINIPVFRDSRTLSPFKEDLKALGDDGSSDSAALPDHVYMDAMAFGMGCSCLQLTFQACNITEARTLYDQLTPLCPILLALSAASPIHHGVLTDIDCRWTVISGSVDDRTSEERGLKPLKNNKFVVPKSRYDSIDCYLSSQGDKYNDVPVIMDQAIYSKLRAHNIDHLLAQHIAHLFIRDTVSLFSEKVQQGPTESDHFENIQSTNWQTMRFKVPPPQSPIGWRVEFRPCELQLTDFENASIVVFVVLLTRVILSYKLNLLIPISKVDENMLNAQKREAVLNGQFWFRKVITTTSISPEFDPPKPEEANIDDQYEAMTINQIINGKEISNSLLIETNSKTTIDTILAVFRDTTITVEGVFPGLIPLINSYLSGMELDVDTHCSMQHYLGLIQKRASGDVMTAASWIRQFVRTHPEYQHDSLVSERINYDLLKTVEGIQDGDIACPELLGGLLEAGTKTTEGLPQSVEKAHFTDQ